jgi:NAD(P)-dependent dehydrogenase (short-subunit alcohol dehydrogenase family)
MAKKWTRDEVPSQEGRRVVVTGGSGGIGLETAKAFAALGADVVIAARDEQKARAAAEEVKAIGGSVSYELLDLASLASVAAFADAMTAEAKPIDVLVNCAGVMAIPERRLTPDGFEMHFGTNHLGHFALTGRLLPLLAASAAARVVTVSARSARSARPDLTNLQLERDYAPMRAYGNSKIANVLFAVELNAHVFGAPILSVPVHPGTALTGIQQYTTSPVERWVGKRIMGALGQPLDRVADPLLFAATSPDATAESFVAPTGLFELGGAPGFVPLPKAAQDPVLRAVLWAESERLTGVTYGTLGVA